MNLRLLLTITLIFGYSCVVAFAQSGQTEDNKAANATESPATESPATESSATDWPMTRGNSLSTGAFPESVGDEFEIEWEFKYAKGAFESGPIIVTQDEGTTVYAAGIDVNVNGKLLAIDLATGKEKWNFEVEDGFVASPAWQNGRLFVGDMLGNLYCVDATGNLKWKHETQGQINSGANFYKSLVLWGSEDATLYALDQNTGKLQWKHSVEDQIQCGATVVEDRCFLAGCDSKFHIIDLEAGNEADAVEIGSPTGVTPAVLGQNVLFGSEEGSFFSIDFGAPKINWTWSDPKGATPIRSSAAVTEGFVVFGARNRKVVALNPDTGDLLWQTTVKAKVDASPIIAGDRVYACSTDGRLYTLDLQTGKILWQKQFNGAFLGSPAIVGGSSPRLVVATERGLVYCLKREKK